ncbi:hypothetical protein TUMEXPCC7403_09915 [Tumidithrix helvetica PCC 7403]
MSDSFLKFWSGWRFLPLWIVATSLGFAIGGPVSSMVPEYVSGDMGNILGYGVMSLAIALPQWLILRGRIRRAYWWLLVTPLGGLVGGPVSISIAWNLSITFGDAVDLFTIFAVLRGTTTGLAQWIFLRTQIPQAGWWVIATSFAWYVSLTIGFNLARKVIFITPSTILGICYGTISGIVMFVLLRKMKFDLDQSITSSAKPK